MKTSIKTAEQIKAAAADEGNQIKNGAYQLCVCNGQGHGIIGHRLVKDFQVMKDSFSADLLDWLILNQEFIPKEFKLYEVYFWGTIYRKESHIEVRYLYWNGLQFTDGYRSLDSKVYANARALIKIRAYIKRGNINSSK